MILVIRTIQLSKWLWNKGVRIIEALLYVVNRNIDLLQHTDKTFYNHNGSVNKTDSLVHLYPFDYLGMAPIAEVTPQFREAKLFPCEGLYCSEPAYIPFKDMLP